jgi:hypothetical protein
MQHICDMFGVRQTDDRTTPKSTRWNIYRVALYYAWGPADVASETRRVCTHYAGASGSAHFSYSFEKIRPSKHTNPPFYPLYFWEFAGQPPH